MKLYISPATCSQSCHIGFEEAGIPVEVRSNAWDEVRTLNPNGSVPVLVFEDGSVLTQNLAILSHIAQQAPQLLPPPTSRAGLLAIQWLAWVNSDLHPAMGQLFQPGLSPEARSRARDKTLRLLAIADAALAETPYLLGADYSLADAYLFVVFNWSHLVQVDVTAFGHLRAHAARIRARPAVERVLQREGLA